MIEDAFSPVPFMANFDIWVNEFVRGFMAAHAHAGPMLAGLANAVTTIGGTAITGGLGILLAVFFFFRKKWRSAAIMFVSICSAGVLVYFLKEFFMRARPDQIGPIITDPSFPSGTATLAAAFFVVLAYLLSPKLKKWVTRELFIVVCVLAIVAIGLSRIVLNVHWVSDVIAGWSLGVFCATASILLIRYVSGLVKGRGV
jgi:undecaprenyl-diphosphatase